MGRSRKGAALAPMIHPGDLVVVHHRRWGRTVVHVHRVSWDGRYIAGPIHESERGEVGTPLIVPRFGTHASRVDISATGTLPLPAAAVPGSTTEIRRDILAAARAEFAEYGPRIQGFYATAIGLNGLQSSSSRASAGVLQLRVSRGRVLSLVAM